jgi:chemotaxis protein methyltransferase CheR
VVIYFTDAAKAALYERLVAALRPGGVLFVGGTEIVREARALGLAPAGPSLYRKADAPAQRRPA